VIRPEPIVQAARGDRPSLRRPCEEVIEAVSGGWPKVISNLKSLLETGAIALQEPYPAAAGR